MEQKNAVANVKNAEVLYKTQAGDDVRLTPEIVRAYLVSGNAAKVSGGEVAMFMRLCQYQQINPFLREAYLIKYDEKTPASIVVGKEAFTKRAERHADFNGQQAGIIVLTKDGTLDNRIGTVWVKEKGETLIGGWAKVYRKNYSIPIEGNALLSEYTTGRSKWATAPATMIRKVALMQALREAFPTSLGAMYDRDEQGKDGDFPGGDIILEMGDGGNGEKEGIDPETGEVVNWDEPADKKLPWDEGKPE
jgi:phage recombination protein Bet